MKVFSLSWLPLLLVISLTVRSQDISESAISRLQQEISKREIVDRDESIPADLKTQNRTILDKRRTELVAMIQARITAVQKYLQTLGDSVTPQEKESAQNSLRELSSVTRGLSSATVSSNGDSGTPLNTATPVGEGPRKTPSAKVTNAEAKTTTSNVKGRVIFDNEHFDELKDGKKVAKTGYESQRDVPLKGATVVAQRVKNDSGREDVASTVTDREGYYSLKLAKAEDSNYVIVASVGDFKTEVPLKNDELDHVDLRLLVRPLGEYSRAIVGFEQAAASAASSTQKFFVDLTLSTPLPWGEVDPYFGRRARLWGTGRVTSVPQQINSGVATFATGFAQQVGNLKVNEVAQAIEFLTGTEIRLTNRMASFGSFDGKTTNKFTVALIAAAGGITPINPKNTLEVFKVFPGAPGLPEIPAGKDFIAFVSPDRDRFFREYYAGLRLQTYYFNYRNPSIPLNRFPAVLDITFGQNEAVTGGRLHGGVLRLEGFYPLPYEGLKFINLYGTALMRLTRSRITDPLILESAPQGITVPAANVFIQTVPQINRDYYRIGVGIDFISFIQSLRAGQH